ncbi:MAG: FAD:protein FMN transferase, partial [Myxococcales bacterium]|nr:FAD:protein FMN transferase [Myxococcales bacterium]
HAVRLAHVGTRLDPGGIGKGYALDRAAAVLRARGVDRALLNFGGQLLALGPPPHSTGWPVRVRNPRGEAPLATFDLARGSVATSADDERGLTIAGRRASHVVDPRSGLPSARNRGVTVFSPSGEIADAWSTALFVMEPGEALAAASREGLDALIVDAAGVGHANTPRFGAASGVVQMEISPSKSSETPKVASRP